MDILDNVATELGFEFHLYIVRDELFGAKHQPLPTVPSNAAKDWSQPSGGGGGGGSERKNYDHKSQQQQHGQQQQQQKPSARVSRDDASKYHSPQFHIAHTHTNTHNMKYIP